jgi:hypothetical protein
LSIFIVVLVGVVFFYLFGFKKALLAEACFIILHPVFPAFTYISFCLCALVFITRYLNKEWTAYKVVRFFKVTLLIFLSLATLGFMIQHLRGIIYPVLDKGYVYSILQNFIDLTFLISFYIGILILVFFYRLYANPMRALWKKILITIGVLFLLLISSGIIGLMIEGVGFYLGAGYAPQMRSLDARYSPYADEMVMEKVSYQNAKMIQNQQISQKINMMNKDIKMEKYQSLSVAKNKVQTGVGFPEWSGVDNIRISMRGNINSTDTLGIYLITPFMNLIIALVQLALSFVILYFLSDMKRPAQTPDAPKGKKGNAFKVAIAVFLMAFIVCTGARADGYPTKEMLGELRAKLTRVEAPACLPNCVAIPEGTLSNIDNNLQLSMLVYASEDVVMPLPVLRADGSGYVKIKNIRLNGKEAAGLVKSDDVIHMSVKKGINTVSVQSELDENADRFSISPGIRINLMKSDLKDLAVNESASGAQTFQINRTKKKETRGQNMPATSKIDIIPYFQVERELDISTIWQVSTTVRRTNQFQESASIDVPLLNGEKVITSEGELLKDSVRLSFAPGESEKSFSSLLPVEQNISLKAPVNISNYKEVWSLNVDSVWSFATKGINPAVNMDGETLFLPSSGQKLTIEVTRPKSVEGNIITIDRVDYTLTPGRSVMTATIGLSLRASEAGGHSINIPKSAEIKDLRVNREIYPIVTKNDTLNIPVFQGTTSIQFTADIKQEMSSIFKFPAFDLNAPAVNIYETAQISPKNWVLFTSGPVKGPAVLFWSQIPVWILLAFILSRAKNMPIAFWQWLVLLIGLSQTNLRYSIIIVTWFVVLALRDKFSEKLKFKKLIQLFIPVLTLIFVFALFKGVHNGLLGIWDMKITGNGSTSYATGVTLKWFQDAISGALPQPLIISVPVWIYRTLMVLWSAWLAFSFVKWIKWAAKSYAKDGMWDGKR